MGASSPARGCSGEPRGTLKPDSRRVYPQDGREADQPAVSRRLLQKRTLNPDIKSSKKKIIYTHGEGAFFTCLKNYNKLI